MASKGQTQTEQPANENAIIEAALTAAATAPTAAAQGLSEIRQRWSKTLPGNRFAALIETLHFQPSDSSKTYTNTDGSMQRKMATAVLVLNGGFACLIGTVSAHQTPNKRKYADFGFIGSRGGGKGFKALDESGRVELDRLCDDIAKYYAEWRKASGVIDTTSRGAELADDDVTFG